MVLKVGSLLSPSLRVGRVTVEAMSFPELSHYRDALSGRVGSAENVDFFTVVALGLVGIVLVYILSRTWCVCRRKGGGGGGKRE